MRGSGNNPLSSGLNISVTNAGANLRPRAKENLLPENRAANLWAGSRIGRGGGRGGAVLGGGGVVGTRPRHQVVCLWRRLLASHHCSFWSFWGRGGGSSYWRQAIHHNPGVTHFQRIVHLVNAHDCQPSQCVSVLMRAKSCLNEAMRRVFLKGGGGLWGGRMESCGVQVTSASTRQHKKIRTSGTVGAFQSKKKRHSEPPPPPAPGDPGLSEAPNECFGRKWTRKFSGCRAMASSAPQWAQNTGAVACLDRRCLAWNHKKAVGREAGGWATTPLEQEYSRSY